MLRLAGSKVEVLSAKDVESQLAALATTAKAWAAAELLSAITSRTQSNFRSGLRAGGTGSDVHIPAGTPHLLTIASGDVFGAIVVEVKEMNTLP